MTFYLYLKVRFAALVVFNLHVTSSKIASFDLALFPVDRSKRAKPSSDAATVGATLRDGKDAATRWQAEVPGICMA